MYRVRMVKLLPTKCSLIPFLNVNGYLNEHFRRIGIVKSPGFFSSFQRVLFDWLPVNYVAHLCLKIGQVFIIVLALIINNIFNLLTKWFSNLTQASVSLSENKFYIVNVVHHWKASNRGF